MKTPVIKLFNLLIAATVLVSAACDPGDLPDINSKTNLALPDIVGKAIVIYSATGGKLYEAKDFNSSGKCDVPMSSSLFSLTAKPTYTYNLKNETEASFEFHYEYKLQIGTEITNSKITVSVKLTFLDKTSGTYSGTSYHYSTSNFTSKITDETKSILGTFKLF